MLWMSAAGPGRWPCWRVECPCSGSTDARMAEVARRHQVPIEVAPFESWEPAGRTYDLVTAGHSWHWIDPLIGLAKAASITVPGATVALFWNYHVVDETLLPAFDDAYRAHAPE